MDLSPAPETIYLKDYKVPPYLIDRVKLYVDIYDQETYVSAWLDIRKNPKSIETQPKLILDGVELELLQIQLNEKALEESSYSNSSESLEVTVSEDAFQLFTRVRIKPQLNTSLEGLYVSKGMYCTQCEAEGFRKITYFVDRPDIMSTYEVTIEADHTQYPQLLSNGNLVASGEVDVSSEGADSRPEGDDSRVAVGGAQTKRGRHWKTWKDPFAKPCYLFALVAGRLSVSEDCFVTSSGREVTLQIFTEPQDQDKIAHAMESLKASMKWDEEVYNREYDLDLYMIVAVSHFNMGAMENKGLNIFNTSCVLASLDTSTDLEFQRVEGVIAHEYFHNWSGNRVTCRDWFQLSLKEGFTVFRDQCFSADMGSPIVKRIEDVEYLRTYQFAEDSGPLAHPVRPESYIEINNFYTLTVYEKGAEIVRMLHTIFGPEGFKKGSDLYFDRHDGQAVTTDEFVQAIFDANSDTPQAKSNIDMEQFKRWYAQAGTPKLVITGSYHPEDKTYTLDIEQTSAVNSKAEGYQPLVIPIKIALLDAQGGYMPLNSDTSSLLFHSGDKEGLLLIDNQKQQVVFQNVDCQPVPSLLRDFSAPVCMEFPYTDEELGFLLSHDQGFQQWESGSQLFKRYIHQGVADFGEAGSQPLSEPLSIGFKHVLSDEAIDDSLKAMLLSPPSILAISETFEHIDVDAIQSVYDEMNLNIASTFRDPIKALYDQLVLATTDEISAKAFGVRSLKNTLLSFMGYLEKKEVFGLVHEAYANAKNMTDRLAALRIMVHHQHPLAKDSLQQFFEQWKHEALVVDKWFGIQATAPHQGTLAEIEALQQHDAFEWTNPNRVRSLIGRFAMANPTQFHRRDGLGYQCLSDAIIKLNAINPQIAARLLQPFARWRRYSSDRQVLMKSELERILDEKDLSPDVFELATKSLEA